MLMAEAIRSQRGGTPTTYNAARQVLEVIPTGAPAQPPDPQHILQRIRDYLSGTDNSQKYLEGAFTPPSLVGIALTDGDRDDRRGAYGVGIYDSFRRYLSDIVSERDVIDLRATRVLMEHKQVLGA